MSESKKITQYRPRGFRFWQPKVIYAEGSMLDGERHGFWGFRYKDEQKQLEGEYIRGKKTGTWTKWTQSGAKLSEGAFLYGKMNGTWTDWYENGQKAMESHWVLGKRDGTWKYWAKDGTANKQETYDHHHENDLAYSIHTDLETKELVRAIQRDNVNKTWKRLVGASVANLVKPWHIACWLLVFVPAISLIKTKPPWRGVGLAAILALLLTSLIAWALDKTGRR